MSYGPLKATVAAGALLLGASFAVAGAPKPQKRAAAVAAAKAKRIELNSATKAQLMSLPDITAAYANKIIAGRPYYTKEDLAVRKIVPNDIYNDLRTKVRVHPHGLPK